MNWFCSRNRLCCTNESTTWSRKIRRISCSVIWRIFSQIPKDIKHLNCSMIFTINLKRMWCLLWISNSKWSKKAIKTSSSVLLLWDQNLWHFGKSSNFLNFLQGRKNKSTFQNNDDTDLMIKPLNNNAEQCHTRYIHFNNSNSSYLAWIN